MNVSAIIVIYNGMNNNWIEKCFDSIINSSISVDIIAIDNGSTDGSVQFIQQKYPQVDFLISKENLGFGKANNIGLKKALDNGAEYFFLINQDAWVDGNTIEQLILQSQKNPKYGVISPLHLNGKGTALDHKMTEFYIKPSKCPNLISDAFLGTLKDEVYEIDFINAAAWLMTKNCLKEIGGFNPVFYHYGEDENYCHRMKFKNLSLGIYPLVSFCHDREERKDNSYFDRITKVNRNLLIHHSNPSVADEDYLHEMKGIKKHFIRIFFSRNLSYRKEIKERIAFLEHNRTQLMAHKRKSRESIPYLFL